MSITREQEMWAIALWVEKHHGGVGGIYISQQMDRLLEVGDLEGVAYWRQIQKRFGSLMKRNGIPF